MNVFDLYFNDLDFVYHAYQCYEQKYFHPDDVESETEYMSVSDLRFSKFQRILSNSQIVAAFQSDRHMWVFSF